MADEQGGNVIKFRKSGEHQEARRPLGVLGIAFWASMILGNIAIWVWLGSLAIEALSKFRP